MSTAMIEALDAEFAEFPVLVAGPPNQSDVEQIRKFAGFTLPSSYEIFVSRYGGAIVGPYRVFGSGASKAMGTGSSSVIDVTNRFRADNWPGSENAIVVSMDHAGNAIMVGENGEVTCFDHDSGDTETLAPNFESFVLDWCLKAT